MTDLDSTPSWLSPAAPEAAPHPTMRAWQTTLEWLAIVGALAIGAYAIGARSEEPHAAELSQLPMEGPARWRCLQDGQAAMVSVDYDGVPVITLLPNEPRCDKEHTPA